MRRLVVVSNRVAKPEAGKGSEGGLAVGVMAAMERAGGLWFGWSGKIHSYAEDLHMDTRGKIDYATADLTKHEYHHYYKGFANSVLWPVFHQRPELMRYEQADLNGYCAVNKKFAGLLAPLLREDDLIWIHDYHMIPLAYYLRELGVKNPIGFFLHTPFPPLDLLRTIPEHRELLKWLCQYDLVGLQTESDLRSLRESVQISLKANVQNGSHVQYQNCNMHIGVFPIGIETGLVPEFVDKGQNSQEYLRLRDSMGQRKLIIGVDRLDYSKGLDRRFLAYERLLQTRKDLHRQLVYLQITPVSRGDVQAYGDFADKIDRIAGHIIGTYADFDWMPLRYLNRGFRRKTILAMYNLAKVGYVTPLRDGMNLVAKEFVAAQNAEDPGVLVLSKMAGAAAELDSALIVNPYDVNHLAKHLAHAVEMPLDERIDRWKKMMDVLTKNNIHQWHKNFIGELRVRAGVDAAPEIESQV